MKKKKKNKKIFTQDNFSIEHVGSTSVKNLSAKPIIDIAIGINDFKRIIKYETHLKKYYTIKKTKKIKKYF
ncbi:MAG: GrpB family protein [Bacilli bacterium]|nr:GrpB family protein [Bacilli bacterium]